MSTLNNLNGAIYHLHMSAFLLNRILMPETAPNGSGYRSTGERIPSRGMDKNYLFLGDISIDFLDILDQSEQTIFLPLFSTITNLYNLYHLGKVLLIC